MPRYVRNPPEVDAELYDGTSETAQRVFTLLDPLSIGARITEAEETILDASMSEVVAAPGTLVFRPDDTEPWREFPSPVYVVVENRMMTTMPIEMFERRYTIKTNG